jgi:hypothetical protein
MAGPQVRFPAVAAGTTVEKYALSVLPEEVEHYLQANILDQYQEQRGFGREPSNLLIDGRSANSISAIALAKRRGQLIYGDIAQMVEAAAFALEQLERLTPVASGAGRASFRVYVNNQELGGAEALTPQLADKLKPTDVLRIVGPTVPYGRKLAWRSGKTKTVNLRAGRNTRIRVKGAGKSAPEVVKQLTARRFRAVNIFDPWISTRYFRAIGKDDRTPSVSVSLKRRGKLYS